MALTHASLPAASQVSIPKTEIHPIYSEHVKSDFELWIAQPQAGFIPSPDTPPKLLVVLDANLCFGTAVEMTRLMHQLYGELPPILVVGIAYPTADILQQGKLRNRDFTPSHDNSLAEMVATLPQTNASAQVSPTMGGASDFLRFLQDEVKPYLSERFEFSTTDTTLFGSSLGGLFSLYALHKAPTAFGHFIAVSPSLWWDREMMFELPLESSSEIPPETPPEQAVHAADCALEPSVFLAAGGLEEAPEIPMLASFKTITNVEKMAERLRQSDRLAVASDILAGETHTSVIPVALTRGLRYCYRRF